MPALDAERSTPFAIRPMTEADADAFARFVADVPLGERRFLNQNLENPTEAFVGLGSDRSARRLIAVESADEIAGVAVALRGVGWSSHVAELQVLVSARHRRKGLGRKLARSALVEALELGCSVAYVEVVSEQEELVGMFQDLGFEPEALLANFVRDTAGQFHDLMLLTHRADDQWGRNTVLGLEEVVG
jgi:ribosomal protein S18 acetylase RimI-like enzyme